MSEVAQAPVETRKPRSVQFIFQVNCAEPGEQLLTVKYLKADLPINIQSDIGKKITVVNDGCSDWQALEFDWDNRTYRLHAGDSLIVYEDQTIHALIGVEPTAGIISALVLGR